MSHLKTDLNSDEIHAGSADRDRTNKVLIADSFMGLIYIQTRSLDVPSGLSGDHIPASSTCIYGVVWCFSADVLYRVNVL